VNKMIRVRMDSSCHPCSGQVTLGRHKAKLEDGRLVVTPEVYVCPAGQVCVCYSCEVADAEQQKVGATSRTTSYNTNKLHRPSDVRVLRVPRCRVFTRAL
jgi:proline racemase